MIFVTNDDGIHAPGIEHLARTVEAFDDVFVVAPDRERSAIGMAITLDRPLRAKRHAPNRLAVDGTPVDCVDLAVGEFLPETPRLLVAGINQGQNLGHDVHFSGTVAAARKGTFLDIPSIAFSLLRGETWHFETACEIVRRVVKAALTQEIPRGVLLNVNIPNVPLSDIRGIRVTRQDPAPYDSRVITRFDGAGVPYYWIGGVRQEIPNREDTDFGVTLENYVSVTPLHSDMTDEGIMRRLREWQLTGNEG